MQLCGRFASDCDWHPKNYCKGTCFVDVEGDGIYDGVKGRIRIEYDADSLFQPPILVPRPFPSIPVIVERVKKNIFKVKTNTSWFSLTPWEKIFDLIGISVTFSYDETQKTFEGTYSVSGGLGIPKDAGQFKSN